MQAYDSVDRELMWKVLARAGIPTEMIAVIRKFHSRMRAQARMDDGELLDSLSVTQGLRQGLLNVPAAVYRFLCRVSRGYRHAVQPG